MISPIKMLFFIQSGLEAGVKNQIAPVSKSESINQGYILFMTVFLIEIEILLSLFPAS